jgi:hypothetical protein
MYKITQNLDGMYYRNKAIIQNAKNCSSYKTIKTYSTCNEDEIEKTEVPTKTDFVKPKTTNGVVPPPAPTTDVKKPVGI